MVLICVATGCNQGPPRPVDIVLDEDSCAECRMAISQLPFAAEAARPGGMPDCFDDIGCLVMYAQHGAPQGSALYVIDFDTRGWLSAESAIYLVSKELPTPMSYGLAAFASEAAAKSRLGKWPGRIIGWEQLLKEFRP
jgi:copper chaperone NosL